MMKMFENWMSGKKYPPNPKKDSTGNVIKDSVRYYDELEVVMRNPDGSIYKQWKEKHNTWNDYGLNVIRDAVTIPSFSTAPINFMGVGATGGATYMSTTFSTANKQSTWVATWVTTGIMSSIASFTLRQTGAGTPMSTISLSTTFTKPDAISLQVTWITNFNPV